MNKQFMIWDNPLQAIKTCVIILLVIGCINVFSASYANAKAMFHVSSYFFVIRYVVGAIVGAVGATIIYRLGYKSMLQINYLFAIITGVVLLNVLVLAIGVEVYGARRWLSLGIMSVQPSEFAKVAVVMLCAAMLGPVMKLGRRAHFFEGGGLVCVGVTLLFGLLVMLQRDMGTASVIGGLCFVMFIVAGVPTLQYVFVMCLLACGGVAAIAFTPFRLRRIKLWLDPWMDPLKDGYQMVQSQIAIGSGGLTGISWGQGVSKFFYLPEAHTDFAFAIFCQENGFLGALVLILCFSIMGAAFFRILSCTKDQRGYLLVCGCTVYVIGQAIVNMAMVTGLLPVVGVPLAFMSYGGTSMITNLAAIALIASVYKSEVQRAKSEDPNYSPERRGDLYIVKGRR